jgi:hypothetical protein
MSKKPWRNPANRDFNNTDVDTSTPQPKAEQPAVSPSNGKPAPAVQPAPGLSDQDAKFMLEECAKLLFTMLGKALDALNLVDHRLLAKVVRDEPEQTPIYATPQKRPRGRVHPLLMLFKYGISAGNLLPRILRMTHSHLFGTGNADAEKTIAATEQIVARLKDALLGKPPAAAAPAAA